MRKITFSVAFKVPDNPNPETLRTIMKNLSDVADKMVKEAFPKQPNVNDSEGQRISTVFTDEKFTGRIDANATFNANSKKG